jgi:diguanylate cyclase (GGDEF)-like protein
VCARVRDRPRAIALVRRLAEDVVDGTDAAQWRLLAWLWALAGLLLLSAVALGVDPEADRLALDGFGLAALTASAVVLVHATRLPARALPWALCGATVALAVSVAAAGEPDSPFALYFTWAGVQAWFFLRTRAALRFTAFAIALSGAVTLLVPTTDADSATWWLMTSGSLLAVGVISAALRIRSDRLIAQLRTAALHDELTGLLNRRGFQQRLDEELARARRHGVPLAVAIGDLDGFKQLNDRFGHRAGDEALRRLAAICDEHLRAGDFMARVGGEEFAIVLPHSKPADAFQAAERLREAIRNALRDPAGAPVTASFGVACHPPHGDRAEVLLDRADQAMYEAKALGRDRTVGFRLDPPLARRD